MAGPVHLYTSCLFHQGDLTCTHAHTCSMFSSSRDCQATSTNPLDGVRCSRITPHQPISPLANTWFYARLHPNAPPAHELAVNTMHPQTAATNRPHINRSKRIPTTRSGQPLETNHGASHTCCGRRSIQAPSRIKTS